MSLAGVAGGRTIHVAYVCAGSVPVFGRRGESVHVQEVVRSLMRKGAEVDLLAERLGGEVPTGLESLRLHRLARTRRARRADRERAGVGANMALSRMLAAIGPVDLVYERYSLWSHAGMEHARSAGVPGLLEVNGPRIEETAERGDLVDRAAAERAAERALAAASAIVAISDEVAAYLMRRFPVDGRVHVIPNGVDPERFASSSSHDRAGRTRPFTVGFVGWFRPLHAFATLIDAFAALRRTHRDARLVLVGDGPERGALQKRLEATGVTDATVLTGSVPPSEVPALLAGMDVGVAPYLPESSHASPLKVLEYMAAGLPVVGGGAHQLGELVEHDRTGLLFEPGDAPALAAALDRLASDPALRSRLGAAGRERVAARHTWDGVVERILRVAGL